jgi:hypothetical protein
MMPKRKKENTLPSPLFILIKQRPRLLFFQHFLIQVDNNKRHKASRLDKYGTMLLQGGYASCELKFQNGGTKTIQCFFSSPIKSILMTIRQHLSG